MDNLTRSGAFELAAKVAGYWAARGFKPAIEVVAVSGDNPTDAEHGKRNFGIVSDLDHRGLPQGAGRIKGVTISVIPRVHLVMGFVTPDEMRAAHKIKPDDAVRWVELPAGVAELRKAA